MIKLIQIIGARPQIIKAAAISRIIRAKYQSKIQDIIIHTGQHYDENMSQIFMHELDIPQETYNLQIGSGTHGTQTARMIQKIEEILLHENPDAVLVYGDTNSTLAAAIAAVKIHIPVIHIEAGLRSFNKSMPEEINRIMCDHASTLLFAPTQTGFSNLKREGFQYTETKPISRDNPQMYYCGDIMYDNTLFYSSITDKKIDITQKYGVEKESYFLATIHRPANTDSKENLSHICNEFKKLYTQTSYPVVLPLHPRTKSYLEKYDLLKEIETAPGIIVTPPSSFLEMIALEKHARCIITDSGGVQKEAFFCKKPAIIVRPETEWIEILQHNCAILSKPEDISKHVIYMLTNPPQKYPHIFGDGKAAEFICETIIEYIEKQS
ncbi:MAG: non-hydrolyzing UDP-N-acetylglucosamine 2-epimerase [bacterium]